MRRVLAGLIQWEESASHQFMKRLPDDVVERAKGRPIIIDLPAMGSAAAFTKKTEVRTFVKFSLRTSDRAVANLRTEAINAHLAKLIAAVRGGPRPLSPRERSGLAGEIFHLFREVYHDDPGSLNN